AACDGEVHGGELAAAAVGRAGRDHAVRGAVVQVARVAVVAGLTTVDDAVAARLGLTGVAAAVAAGPVAVVAGLASVDAIVAALGRGDEVVDVALRGHPQRVRISAGHAVVGVLRLELREAALRGVQPAGVLGERLLHAGRGRDRIRLGRVL